MSDYNNYNGYEPNVANVAPGAPIVLNQQPEKDSTALGIWSIVLAVCSCCCCGLPGIVGLILGIVGAKNEKGRGLCIAGIILSILAIIGVIIFGIAYISSTAALANDPEFMEQYMQMMEQYAQAMESAGGMQ